MYNNLPKTLFIGRSIIYLPTCHSTNDMATNLIGKPEIFEGTVVVTSTQTAGKGQRGNSWESEPFKNLTFSLLLKPSFLRVSQQFNLNIAISLAVFDLLTIYLGEKVKIKWPNDIFFVNNPISKKLCGILIQNFLKKDSIENSIIGIGININQKNFVEEKAISLAQVTKEEHDLEKLLNIFLEKAEARYLELRNGDVAKQKQEYYNVLYSYNEERFFRSAKGEFKGKIVGIDETGRLLIETISGTLTFSFKEVEFI